MSIETKLLQHQTLTTARLTLRPVHLNDAAMFLRVGSDSENNRFTIRYADEEAVLEALATYWIGQPLGKYTIALNNRPIGAMGLHWTDCATEIGYFLDKRYWHHGYATETAQALILFFFNTLKLLRVEGRFDARNPASGKVLSRLGMYEEGRLVNERIADGISVTTVIMAKTR